MSFVSTGEMTRKAQREGYAVPAFNAENLEMAQAIIQAASREGSPVILQTTLPTARYWGMEEAVAVTASLAQEAPVPVALHLDHSNSFDEVMRAAMTAAVWETMEGDREVIDPKKYLGRGREAVERLCVEKIRLCGSNGRA